MQPEAGGGAARRDRRDRAVGTRRGEVGELLPLADPLRRATRLRPHRSDLRRHGARTRSGRGGDRDRAGSRRRDRCAERRSGPGGDRLGARVHVQRRGRCRRGAGARPDRGPPVDREADDPDQRAGGAPARAQAGPDALPRPRTTRPGAGPGPDRATRITRRADAGAGRVRRPERCRAGGDRGEPPRRRRGEAPRTRREQPVLARAAFVEARSLQLRQRGSRRPRQRRLRTLHLPDPPLSRSDRPSRAALGRRSKRACADRARGLGRRRALLRQGAGLDADRARRRRRLRRLPAPARAVRARLGHGLRGRGLRRDLRGCFHPVPWSALRRIRGLLPGPAHARRTVRDQRRRIGADGNADGPSGRDRRRDRGQGRVGRGSPRPGRSDRRRRADAPQAGSTAAVAGGGGGGGRNRNRRGSKGRR